MTIKFKKLSDKAVQPVRTTSSGAGYNLTTAEVTTEVNERGQLILVYHSNIGVEIPAGYEGVIRPIETIFNKTLRICNAPCTVSGNIDDDIVARFITTTDVVPAVYKEGEQFAQLVINKIEDTELVEYIDTTSDNEDSAPEGSQSLPDVEDASTNSETATGGSGGEENIPEQA